MSKELKNKVMEIISNKTSYSNSQGFIDTPQYRSLIKELEALDWGEGEFRDWIEPLADLEHRRWSSWQSYMHSLCTKNHDGTLTIPINSVNHWERQIRTDYKNLTEKEKESDRKEARKTIEVITKAQAEQALKQLKE